MRVRAVRKNVTNDNGVRRLTGDHREGAEPLYARLRSRQCVSIGGIGNRDPLEGEMRLKSPVVL